MTLLEQKFKCGNILCNQEYELKEQHIELIYKTKYEPRKYYFCSDACIIKFLGIENTLANCDN